MRAWLVSASLVAVCPLAGGCGHTCEDTCNRFYAEDECDGRGPGFVTEIEAIQSCQQACSEALKTPGPAPSESDPAFNPALPYASSLSSVNVLTNEQEAAAWIDCVWFFEDTPTCKLELGGSPPKCARVLAE